MNNMIKKIDIAGIQVDNYTVRESIMLVEKNISRQIFTTLEEVNMQMLLLAETDERMRESLEKLDYSVIAETGILNAVGENSIQRKREIEDHDFYFELLKRLERNHKSIFLLGKSREELEQALQTIEEDFPKCRFVGAEAMDECVGATDAIVNEINAATPDVVISILPTPEQEYFLLDNRNKLSTTLWYGMGSEKIARKKHGFIHFIRNMISLRKLEHTITSYEEKETGNE